MKINDYIIINSDTSGSLSSKVNDWISDGYVPHGSAYCAVIGERIYHYQPMIRYEGK